MSGLALAVGLVPVGAVSASVAVAVPVPVAPATSRAPVVVVVVVVDTDVVVCAADFFADVDVACTLGQAVVAELLAAREPRLAPGTPAGVPMPKWP